MGKGEEKEEGRVPTSKEMEHAATNTHLDCVFEQLRILRFAIALALHEREDGVARPARERVEHALFIQQPG